MIFELSHTNTLTRKPVDAAATNLKRPREDDAAAAPAAKKVDTKDE